MSGATSYRVSARLEIEGDAERALQRVSRALTALDAGIGRTERSIRDMLRALGGLGAAPADLRRTATAMDGLRSSSTAAAAAARSVAQGVQAQAGALDRAAQSAGNAAAAMRNLSGVRTPAGGIGRLGEAVALGAGGRAISGRLGQSLAAAGEAQNQAVILGAAGVGPEDRARVEARAWEMTRLVRGTTMAENLQLLGQLRTTFGTLEDAMSFAPEFARIGMVLSAVTGRDPGRAGSQAAKFLDTIDAYINPATGQIEPGRGVAYARMMENALILNQGTVTPEDYLNFAKQGRLAVRRMDPAALFGAMPAVMEQIGGHRAGTELAAMYRQIVSGVMTQRVADEMVRRGLLAERDIQVRRGGSVVVRPGSVVGSELFAANAPEWVRTVLMPRLAATGATSQDAQFQALSTLFGTETARGLAGQLIASMPQIVRSMEMYRAMHPNAGGAVLAGSWNISVRNLQSAFTNLMNALGSAVMDDAIAGMNALADGLNRLAGWVRDNPRTAAAIVELAGALGVLMTAGAAFAAGSLALSGLTGLAAALGGGALGVGLAGALTAVAWGSLFGALAFGINETANALRTGDWSRFKAVADGLASLAERLGRHLGITGRDGGPGVGEMPEYDAQGNPTGRTVPIPPGIGPPRNGPYLPPGFGMPDPGSGVPNLIPQGFNPPARGGGLPPIVLINQLDGREISRATLPHLGREVAGPPLGPARYVRRMV